MRADVVATAPAGGFSPDTRQRPRAPQARSRYRFLPLEGGRLGGGVAGSDLNLDHPLPRPLPLAGEGDKVLSPALSRSREREIRSSPPPSPASERGNDARGCRCDGPHGRSFASPTGTRA